MEIGAKEARNRLGILLKKVEEGSEIVIVRKGKRVARLIAAEDSIKQLPTLKNFRASVKIKGASFGALVSHGREEARY